MSEPKPIPVHTMMDAAQQMPPSPETDVVVYLPTDAAKAAVRECEVLMAVDAMNPDRVKVLKGEKVLDGIIRSGVARPVKVLRVELDLDTSELEWLAALVKITGR